jgi:zinc resistance-associated protein
MWKKVLVLSTALALAGSGALAQQRFEGRGGDGLFQQRGPSLDDLAAFTDARVAALKAGLRLTPEQEANWPAFEQAYRNLAKLRTDRAATGRGQTTAPEDQNMVDRLQRRADAVSQYGAALQDLAKSARPLYASLDDAQKRRFVALTRFMSPRRHFAMGGRDAGGPGMMDRGMMGHGMMGPGMMGRGFGHGPGRPGDGDE